MFLELAEYLKCPTDHAEEPLIVATGAMKGRSIVFGTIGCPVCHAEFVIVNRIAQFDGPARAAPPPADRLPETDAVHALLGLASPGGYVVLLGSAARLADGLAQQLEGVHFIGVCAPDDVEAGAHLSLLSCTTKIPLRSAMARGVVVGAERAEPEWLAEAVRVVLPGQRVVVLRDDVSVDGVERLAAGQGMWVGKRTG